MSPLFRPTLRSLATSVLVGLSWSVTGAQAAPGEGVKVGEHTTLTPSLDLGVEFSSNPFLSVGAIQSGRRRDEVQPAFNFLLSPAFLVKVKAPKVAFTFDGRYSLRKFFEQEVAERLDRFTDFKIKSRLDVLPQSVVGFYVGDTATFINRASDNPFAENSLVTQFRNDAAAGLVVRPGPDFDITAGFNWGYHNYQLPGFSDPQRPFNKRNTYSPSLEVQWRFFPRTAFVFDASVDLNRWQLNWVPTGQQLPADGTNFVTFGQFLALPDSDFVKLLTGIRGRFTKHFVLTAQIGYGGGFYKEQTVIDAASDPGLAGELDPAVVEEGGSGFGRDVAGIDSLLAVVRTTVDLGFSQQKTFGQRVNFLYRKDFQDSFFTNYVHQHNLTIGLDSLFGRFVETSLDFGVRFEKYRGESDRNDIFLTAGGYVRVKPAGWLDVDVVGRWGQRASSQQTVQYDNVQAAITLRVKY